MIDHVGLGVSDLEQSRTFYKGALRPLGYHLPIERDGSAGFGSDGKPGSILEVTAVAGGWVWCRGGGQRPLLPQP